MKKNNFNSFAFCILLLACNSIAYASTPPTTPLWDASNGPTIVFSNSEIALFWLPSTSSVGLAGYYIYRCTGTNCNLPSQPTFNVTDPTSTFWGDATLSAGTSYSYTIAAYDTAGNISAQSAVTTATTTGSSSDIVPVIGFGSGGNGVGQVGDNFNFIMNGSTLTTGGLVYGNSNYNWNWDFGDGTTFSSGSSVGHSYSKVGTYTVTLTIYNTSSGDQASVQQSVTVIPPTIAGLVLRLRSNGDINDYSGNQLVITPGGAGMPGFASGVSGHGIYLDGTLTGSYGDVKDNALLDGLSALTLSVHAMKNTASASGTIYIKQGEYSISLASQGVTATLTNSTGTTVTLSAPSVSNNNILWHHYAVTYDGTTAILYFDGTNVASQAFSGFIAINPTSDLLLGITPSGNTFNGSLDWVRLYNQALTLSQIQFLYNGSNYGDVSNGGGNPVTIYDAYLTAEYAVGLINLNSPQLAQAKVTGEVNPTIYDAELIAQKSVGLILKFPADITGE